jgi:predicted lipoprotein with Yx(FWY)xxD motif
MQKEVRIMKMKKSALVLTLAIVAGIILAAGSACAADNVVKVAKKDGVGKYLTDIKGMTLYAYKKDSAGKSTCVGECADKWPVYYRAAVSAKDELDAKKFGIFMRSDGKKQTTYKGMPLYYFKGDMVAGDMIGQGVDDIWFIVAP